MKDIKERNVSVDSYVDCKTGDMNFYKNEMKSIMKNFYDDPFNVMGVQTLNYVIADEKHVTSALANLYDRATRDSAIEELYNYKDSLPCFSELIWNSYGCLTILTYELSSSFLFTTSDCPDLAYCKRITKILAIFSRIINTPEISKDFSKAKWHSFLFPIVKCNRQLAELEYIKIGCLSVMYEAMSKNGMDECHYDLIKYVYPSCIYLCLRGMSFSKTIGVYIIEKLICHQIGLECLLWSPDIFIDIFTVMVLMGQNMLSSPDELLIKHLISCFKNIISTDGLFCMLQKVLKSGDVNIDLSIMRDNVVNNGEETETLLIELCKFNILPNIKTLA